MRRHRFLAVAESLAKHESAHQARDTRVDVNDRAAGEVENTLGGPEAARRLPHHVRDRRVDEERPQAHEPEHRREFHAVSERTGNQRGRDDGKCHLERHVDRLGNRRPEMTHRHLSGLFLEQHAVQEQPVEAPEERAARDERDAVAGDDPEHGYEAGDREALHHRRQHVLLAHHAAIEQRKPGDRHQQHQRGRSEHPRRVAAVDLVDGDELGLGRCGGGRGGRSSGSLRLGRFARLGLGSRSGGSSRCRRGRRGCGGFLICSLVLCLDAAAYAEDAGQGDQREHSLHGVPLRVHPRRFRRYGCARPVRGRKRRSCRRRSSRYWRLSRQPR